MFDSKYGKVLTIGLIIAIIAIIGVLVYFTVDFIKNSNIKSDAKAAVDEFIENTNANTKTNKVKNNTTVSNGDIVSLNVQAENIVSGGTGSNTSSNTNTYKGFPMVGTIEIPKINLKYPVLENASAKAIEVAVAVHSGVGLNKPGNTVIIGHNYRNGTFFSNLKNLTNGDKVYITATSGAKVEYKIYNSYTTNPEDSDYMDRDTQGKREVTLITCTDDTKSRLVLYASAD